MTHALTAHKPDLTFNSERLVYRPLGEDDISLSVELWTDPEITRFTGGALAQEKLVTEHPVYMRRCAKGCIGVWTLATLRDNEKIGTAILLPMPVDEDDTNWDLGVGDQIPDGEIEVGYILKKSAWGNGYATEACKRMLKFGFENTMLDEIVGTIDHDNHASRHVLLKSGLKYEGIRRSYGGELPFFKITRSEWLEGLKQSQKPATG